MALDINAARTRATRAAKSFSPQQLLILGGLTVVSVMGLIALVRWVSQPTYSVLVAGASVKATVLSHGRGDKVIIFKRKRRKRYRLTKGHRQHFTEVLVREISCGPDKKSVDEKTAQRSRVRAQALQRQKIQVKKPTRREKVAAQSTEK